MEREPPADDRTFMARAFATARRRMSAVPAAVSGYRLFWVRQSTVGWRDLPAGGPYAILGSHELCDGVFPDPGVALRHVLATTVELSDGPALRLLDLHTDMPFRLQDGSPQRSIVGAGEIVARVGWTVFGGVPIEEGRAPEAPPADPALPDLVVASSALAELPPEPEAPAAPDLPPSPPAPSAAQSAPSAPGPSSPAPSRARVTSLPPSRMVADLPHRAEDRPPPPAAPVSTGAGSWPVTLERNGRASSVILTDEELSLGVVIGRAVNCHDQGLRAVLDMGVSRGHLLLLHHHDTYEAYDLRSMNGTWEAGRQVQRRRLGDEGVTLTLSNHEPVVLRWHGRR